METQKKQLLKAALPLVAFEGWTAPVLAQAAEKSGLEKGMEKVIFPGGASELVDYFVTEMDQAMVKSLAKQNLASLKIRERIAYAVKTRLMLYQPYRPAVVKTLAHYALPQHTARGAILLWQAADHMWNAAGDTATDWNYYSKRLLLAGVYSSTLLFWIGDESEDYANTWEFLGRRIEEVLSFGKILKKVAGG